MIICEECGARNRNGAYVCTECGASLLHLEAAEEEPVSRKRTARFEEEEPELDEEQAEQEELVFSEEQLEGEGPESIGERQEVKQERQYSDEPQSTVYLSEPEEEPPSSITIDMDDDEYDDEEDEPAYAPYRRDGMTRGMAAAIITVSALLVITMVVLGTLLLGKSRKASITVTTAPAAVTETAPAEATEPTPGPTQALTPTPEPIPTTAPDDGESDSE